MWVEALASVGQQGTEQGLKEAQLCLRFHHWLHHEALDSRLLPELRGEGRGHREQTSTS